MTKNNDWEKQIEEVLANRILYIGNEIPEYFVTEKRDKQLYLGYPKQLIDELTKLFKELIQKTRRETIEEIEHDLGIWVSSEYTSESYEDKSISPKDFWNGWTKLKDELSKQSLDP